MTHRITSTLATLLLAATAMVGFSTITATPAQAKDLDCSDFPSQAAAQRNLDANPSDPNGLDTEGDGVACESNPCPCARPGSTTTNTPSTKAKSAPKPARTVQDAVVTRVVDSDTIEVRFPRGDRANVRVLGVEAPNEYNGEQCYDGPESRAFAKKKLPRGTAVRLESDSRKNLTDGRGRIVRYVRIQTSGADFGKLQIRRGSALIDVSDEPFTRARAYTKAERRAWEAAQGLWAAC